MRSKHETLFRPNCNTQNDIASTKSPYKGGNGDMKICDVISQELNGQIIPRLGSLRTRVSGMIFALNK